MNLTAEQLYKKLVTDFKLVGQKGRITFTLKDITVKIETKDSVGNLIQEWLKEWMKNEKIEFKENMHDPFDSPQIFWKPDSEKFAVDSSK